MVWKKSDGDKHEENENTPTLQKKKAKKLNIKQVAGRGGKICPT